MSWIDCSHVLRSDLSEKDIFNECIRALQNGTVTWPQLGVFQLRSHWAIHLNGRTQKNEKVMVH